jgi:thiol-disulfide isomerase/thioredoxin
MNHWSAGILTLLLIASMFVGGCSKSPAPKPTAAHPPGSLSELLKDNHGRVLVLLCGVEGCPGTAKATADLDNYLSAKPEGVSVVRLDVPPPNKTIQLAPGWNHKFPQYLDEYRKIAGELDFFYYPTLYVFDGDGDKRYAGGCDKDKVAAMVREISAEKPGAKKKIYTVPMPAVGESAPAFSRDTLAGKAVTLKSLAGKHGLLIIFARTSCGFSKADMPQFKQIADSFDDKGVAVAVVNQQEELADIKPIYAEKCPGVPVVWDRYGDIGRSYGVDAVPFFFLLDDHGKIVSRTSFTEATAINSISSMLGVKAPKPAKAAGGG